MAVYKKENRYYIDYYFNGRRVRESAGPNRQLAFELLHKRKTQIAEREFFPNRMREKILFQDMSKMYYELHSLVNKRSAKSADKIIIKQLNVFFKDKYLHEISSMMVEQYRSMRKARVKLSTVNREHQCLRHIFTKAIEWGKTINNPAKGIKLFRVENIRLRFLDKEEIQVLITCCDDRIKPIVMAALNTGMRRGEIKNLRWKDIDLGRGIIYLLQTKSGKPREIPINGILRKLLEWLPRKEEKVFDTSNLRKLYEKAVTDAKLEDVNFHTLRHTFASHLVMAGIDLTTVKELLGHQTLEMTMRYAHLSKNHKQLAVEILGGRWTPIWTPKGVQSAATENSITKNQVDLSINNDFRALSSVG